MTPQEKLQFMRQAELNPGLAMLTMLELLRKETQTMVIQEVARAESALPDKVVLKHIEKLKGDKGDQGDMANEEMVVQRVKDLVLSLMPKPKDGEPGFTPTKDELLTLIIPLIPQVKDGYTPTTDELKRIIQPLIPTIELPESPTEEELSIIIRPIVSKLMPQSITLEQVLDTIASDPSFKIDASKITGLPRTQKSGKYYHGGGDTVVAGTNISISRNTSTGVVTISSTGGVGPWSTPTESPKNDGSVLIFTVGTSPPVDVVGDGLNKYLTIDYTYSSPTITFLANSAPTQSVRFR